MKPKNHIIPLNAFTIGSFRGVAEGRKPQPWLKLGVPGGYPGAKPWFPWIKVYKWWGTAAFWIGPTRMVETNRSILIGWNGIRFEIM